VPQPETAPRPASESDRHASEGDRPVGGFIPVDRAVVAAPEGAAAALARRDRLALGIDIGGTTLKAGIVDVTTGIRLTERLTVAKPVGGEPEDIADVIAEIVLELTPDEDLPVGVGVPGIVRDGIVRSSAHISDRWLGMDARTAIRERSGIDVLTVNDADAAGVAELEYGVLQGRGGLVILTTLGTGIGTALLHDGKLIPNSELGHVHIDGGDYEMQAAFSAVRREGITFEAWAARLERYYRHLESIMSPDLLVVGGAAAHEFARFAGFLHLDTEIIAASRGNDAGLVGAALLAHRAGVAPD
jgi:polyphosphate glucokinase